MRSPKPFLLGLAVALVLGACASQPPQQPQPQQQTPAAEQVAPQPVPAQPGVLDEEARASFRFFWEQANSDATSAGYGLVRDRWPGNPTVASIASTGFGLSAVVVGVERGWITRAEGEARALGTLTTFSRLETEHGFFHHFLDVSTGRVAWDSEVSTIDTGLFIAGALTAGSYFGGAVEKQARALYEAIDWPWFVDAGRNQFWMAYRPAKGFEGHWDFYAEQLILYVLAAGSPTHPVPPSLYEGFTRDLGTYGALQPFIHSWFGSIFTYQYSHAWIDFRGWKDPDGVDWFANSTRAVQAQRALAVDNPNGSKSLGPDSWGFSASDGPWGYNGLYGAPPSGFDDHSHVYDGTIPPSAAVGSIVFTPAEATAAMVHYRANPSLWGPYGFIDAFNLDVNPAWFDGDVIGIDKGIGLLMLENARSGAIWKAFMATPSVRAGLERLGFTR
jgi:hypothetical protein